MKIQVGDARAPDRELLRWARENDRCILTHDLDFGALVVTTGASGPSVVQIRALDLLPAAIGPVVLAALEQHGEDLAAGALVTLDARTARVRVLVLRALTP